MKKMSLVALAALLLLLSSILPAQGTIKVASVYGPVAALTLELPDGAFMIVYENSTRTIQKLGASNLRNLINVVMGNVRFYIQRPGGKSKPRGAGTPTALIAVRG